VRCHGREGGEMQDGEKRRTKGNVSQGGGKDVGLQAMHSNMIYLCMVGLCLFYLCRPS
jgi:hypothetical protein